MWNVWCSSKLHAGSTRSGIFHAEFVLSRSTTAVEGRSAIKKGALKFQADSRTPFPATCLKGTEQVKKNRGFQSSRKSTPRWLHSPNYNSIFMQIHAPCFRDTLQIPLQNFRAETAVLLYFRANSRACSLNSRKFTGIFFVFQASSRAYYFNFTQIHGHTRLISREFTVMFLSFHANSRACSSNFAQIHGHILL